MYVYIEIHYTEYDVKFKEHPLLFIEFIIRTLRKVRYSEKLGLKRPIHITSYRCSDPKKLDLLFRVT